MSSVVGIVPPSRARRFRSCVPFLPPGSPWPATAVIAASTQVGYLLPGTRGPLLAAVWWGRTPRTRAYLATP